MAAPPSPTTPTVFQFDSFDFDGGGGLTKVGDISLCPSVTHSPLPTPRLNHQVVSGKSGGDVSSLVEEVTRLCRERQRLARLHHKAEQRVMTNLAQRKQSDDGNGAGDGDDDNDDDDSGWESRASAAREALVAADKEAATSQLRYKLLLEEARSQAEAASTKASNVMEKFVEQQRQLVKHSFSPLPPEPHRNQVVDEFIRRQQKAEEQLREARLMYFSLALRYQRLKEEQNTKQQTAPYQVSKTEMLRLIVETEAYTQEAAVQDSSIDKHKSSLKHVEGLIARRIRENSKIEEEVKEAEEEVQRIKLQLMEEKEKLKNLCDQQTKARKSSNSIQPVSRLAHDPLLATDLKEKLDLKINLEDELQRLKQEYGENKKSGIGLPKSSRKRVTLA